MEALSEHSGHSLLLFLECLQRKKVQLPAKRLNLGDPESTCSGHSKGLIFLLGKVTESPYHLLLVGGYEPPQEGLAPGQALSASSGRQKRRQHLQGAGPFCRGCWPSLLGSSVQS
jgi:hypothetical protein